MQKMRAAIVSLMLGTAAPAMGQHSHAAPTEADPMSEADMRAMAAHMKMTTLRPVTAADSARAHAIVAELRGAIGKYRDVKRAEADGFKMFAPQIKNQRVYHFTKRLWAIENQFRFNPGKPTSLLYRRDSQGSFVLIGRPVFGPFGVSTREDCDAAGGRFHEEVLGWMVHANIFDADVWGDHHMRGDELGTGER